MAETKVTLAGYVGIALRVATHVVYTRAKWSDEWTIAPTLHCDEAVWSVAPSIPTATLHNYYGSIAREGAVKFSRENRVSKLRSYVKIVFTLSDYSKLNWYGVIEVDENDIDGAVIYTDPGGETQVLATGEQTLSAYGMEQLLAGQVVTSSVVFSSVEVGRGIPFNDRGKPNGYHFEGDIYEFADSKENAEYWKTRWIIHYLINHHTPRNKAGDVLVPFSLPFSSYRHLPRWDKPQLEQHGRTTYSLISSLIARERMLFWYLDVDESESPNKVVLRINTAATAPIDIEIPDAEPILVNESQKHLIFDADASARAVVKTSSIESFDRFVVLGARRRSVFSLGFDDSTIAIGWTTLQETLYEEGAKYATAYPASTELTSRRKLNSEVRSTEELKDVYVRFIIPETWNGKVGAGDGSSPLTPAFPVIQTDGTIEDDPAPFFQLGLFVDQSIPLLESVDYSGGKIKQNAVDESESSGVERPPLVAWKLPNTTPQRWQNVEDIGRKAELETEDPDEIEGWSVEVIVPQRDRGIRLHVHGEPRHIIAKTDFTGQPEDMIRGDNDYRDMICTLSVTEDRHAVGLYPPEVFVDAATDFVRTKVIDAGDAFRQDYVCPETVVDIDNDGALVRSDGGFVRDDTSVLKAVATVAWEWYGRDRKVLSLTTDILTSEITIGDMVSQIGDDTVPGEGNNIFIGTVVTEVRIATRRHTGDGEPDPPRMQITTGWGELDPLQLLNPDDQPLDGSRPKDALVSAFDVSRGV